MKYTCELDIARPRDRVIELFDDPDNLKKWQPGLLEFTPLEGTPGQPGATSRLLYQMGKRRMEMIETITVRDLPDEFSGTYETNGVFNRMQNRFIDRGTTTHWVVETEFIMSGFMKIISFIMGPGPFRKETMKTMEHFKAFAESEPASNGAVAPAGG